MTSTRHLAATLLVVTFTTLSATVAAAGQSADLLPPDAHTGGWTLVPSMTTGTVWDDNVLIEGNGAALSNDQTATLTPALQVGYDGRRTDFSLAYTGGFTKYRSFSGLDAFEQTARVQAARRLTKHTTLSAFQSFTSSPTTDLLTLVGVPFVRIGSQVATTGAQVEAALTKRTSVTAAYRFESVRFDKDPQSGAALVGGSANGGRVGLRRQFSRRATATVDYDLMRATLVSGGMFSIQNAWLGGEYRLTDLAHVFAMIAIARLDTPDLPRPRLQPAWRTGIARAFGPAGVEVSYGRTFVPSYGGSGTQSSKELTSRLRLPVAGRLYAEGYVAWRRDATILATDVPLTSVWMNGAVGYTLRPWARVEAFYSGLRQRIDRAGGALDRNRIGIQFSTSTPMRLH